MDRRELTKLHKFKPTRFDNADTMRQNVLNKFKLGRQERRTQNFNSRRNIDVHQVPESNTQAVEDKVLNRRLALLKFKSEREEKKRAIMDKKKPPFVVGIPHHGSSPVLKELTNQDLRNKKPQLGKGIEFAFPAIKAQSTKKLTSPHTPTVLKRSAQKNPCRQIANPRAHPKRSKPPTASNDSAEPLAVPLPQDNNVKVANDTVLVTEEPRLSQEQVRNSNVDLPVAEHLHNTKPSTSGSCDELGFLLLANVDMRRDRRTSLRNRTVPKSSPRSPSSSGLRPLSSPGPETSDSGSFQRSLVDGETIRLLALAEEWETVALQVSTPGDVIDEIDSLVGQTRLLTRDKFNQFRGLITQYENGEGDHKVTSEDLNGFWDMIFLQVETLVKRYTKLQNRKDLNWQEQKEVIMKKKCVTKRSKPAAAASSALREAIKAKRAKLTTTTTTDATENDINKTPVSKKKGFMAQVLSHGNRSRSNSPAAYMAMRLSGVGRPSDPNETVEPTTATKSILKSRIQSEQYIPKRKTVLFGSSFVENGDIQGDARESAHLNIKTEEINEDQSAIAEQPLNEETFPKDESLKVTPRRSLRLMQRSPTPVKSRICRACKSPDNSNSEKRKSLRRSQKNILPMNEQKSEEDKVEDKDFEAKETTPTKPSSSGKTFVLRPSKLASVTNSLGAVPKKTRRSRRVKVRTTDVSPAEDSSGNEELTQKAEIRSSVRKSSRIRASRSVTFNSSAEEKIYRKLPATPFQKSGGKKVAESPQTPNCSS